MFSEDMKQIDDEETLQEVNGGCGSCFTGVVDDIKSGEWNQYRYGSGLDPHTPPSSQSVSRTSSSSSGTTEVTQVASKLKAWVDSGKKNV